MVVNQLIKAMLKGDAVQPHLAFERTLELVHKLHTAKVLLLLFSTVGTHCKIKYSLNQWNIIGHPSHGVRFPPRCGNLNQKSKTLNTKS